MPQFEPSPSRALKGRHVAWCGDDEDVANACQQKELTANNRSSACRKLEAIALTWRSSADTAVSRFRRPERFPFAAWRVPMHAKSVGDALAVFGPSFRRYSEDVLLMRVQSSVEFAGRSARCRADSPVS